MLENTDNYKYRKQSKCKQIEKQANCLIKNITKNKLDKSSYEKLISTGSQPANFATLIKDHKKITETGFPLRPLASTINTPTNKIDWLVSRILNQLLIFIPSYIRNTDHLIEKLKNVSVASLSGTIFVSLDVVNLYPSIPISEAIKAVLEFASSFWDSIDTFGFSMEELGRCLTFISYNYEVQFQEKTYLQIKGCPMGAHFSPPFAIIFMHKIETEALTMLNNFHNIFPQLYSRYIDDIIIGPFPRDNDVFRIILEVFNNINSNIQFTMEIPGETTKLNFLDITIMVTDTKIEFEWYRKSCHSGILLREDSHVPQHVKRNFITSTIRRIENRCCNDEVKRNNIAKFKNSLKNNGYGDNQVWHYTTKNKRIMKQKNTGNSRNNFMTKTPFVMHYINEKMNRSINKLIRKYDLDVRLVSKPGISLENILKKKIKKGVHQNCDICSKLGTGAKNNCNARFVVYRYTCNICNKAYIGQTARPFFYRHREHRNSIVNRSYSSALGEHICLEHNNDNCTIDSFRLDFLEVFKTPIASRIGEAMWINKLKPSMNRRQELVHW
jgi:hypothetical protein